MVSGIWDVNCPAELCDFRRTDLVSVISCHLAGKSCKMTRQAPHQRRVYTLIERRGVDIFGNFSLAVRRFMLTILVDKRKKLP